MVRQCAWCLRLIDNMGERLSSAPQPKLYDASHGICAICGTHWMEQFLASPEKQGILYEKECDYIYTSTYLEDTQSEKVAQWETVSKLSI